MCNVNICENSFLMKVNFCDPRICVNKNSKKWEIVGNVVNFKNSRSVDGADRQLSSSIQVKDKGMVKEMNIGVLCFWLVADRQLV